jgi:hypothetical protein
MNLVKELFDSLSEDYPLRGLLVGAHWTVVCSRGCGLASTITGDKPHAHDKVRDVGRLHEKSARELAQYALSDIPLEASIGLAALNSLLPVDASRSVELNAADVLRERGAGKNVALVGHFPFIEKVRQSVGNLWVLEQRPTADEYPAEAAVELIPQADLVALTASALINHTLDGLLALCRPESLVIMIGPSTPLSPLLFERGVDILSGSLVVDEAAVLRCVAQGATYQQIEGVKRITLVKDG